MERDERKVREGKTETRHKQNIRKREGGKLKK
jgi:hypothetical protein